MRFHVVGLPFKPQPQCAYHGKVVRFVKMMRDLGHEVFEYQAPAVTWDKDRAFDPGSPSWNAWNMRAIKKIAANAEHHDFICVIAGWCQQPIAAAFPHMMTVEFGVGYGGVFAPYKVFESYAWMHTVYGSKNPEPHAANGFFYDAVIPNYFDVAEFPKGKVARGKDRNYAYVGRLIDRKGPAIAADVCRHLRAQLVVAGEGDAPPDYGKLLGVVDGPERARIMGEATAVFVPTLYVEPFGGVAVEAMLCGTPVITTDFGAFSETVVDGVTGFRCHTLSEFVDAAKACAKFTNADRDNIRQYAIDRYSLEAVGPMYEKYFERLDGLWGEGWNHIPE